MATFHIVARRKAEVKFFLILQEFYKNFIKIFIDFPRRDVKTERNVPAGKRRVTWRRWRRSRFGRRKSTLYKGLRFSRQGGFCA